MRLPARSLVSIAAASFFVFAAAAVAWADTCSLELKRFDQPKSANADAIYRTASPQTIFVQVGKDRVPIGNQEQAAAFKRLVTKEPKYQSENPFRGVVKLGSQEFAFALDAATPPSKDAEADADKTKKKEDEKPKTTPPAKTPARSATAFNRLYFDLNHNGDLTDDKVIEAKPPDSALRAPTAFQFPRVDVTLDTDGVKSDYSFFLQGQSVSNRDFSYVVVSLVAGGYREGHITLDGKKHHVVLIDFNSNGRFGDENKLDNIKVTVGGRSISQSRREQGDMLLVDPDSSKSDSPYDILNSEFRHYVAKLVGIDGRVYDMKVSPAGDKLTLDPCSTPQGKVTLPSGSFRGLICSEQGFLKISGDKDAMVSVPEGQWKLLSYSLHRVDADGPKKPDKQTEKKGSLLESLAKDLSKATGGPPSVGSRNLLSIVAANVPDSCKPIKVVKGETVALGFGPPYKATVTAQFSQDAKKNKTLSLGLSLIGSGGETCSNLLVHGGRPSKPKITITDDKGKVVQEGNFEYG